MSFKSHNVYWLWLSALVIVTDQISKQLVHLYIGKHENIYLLDVLNLTHIHNTGAAFSILSNAPPLFFIAIGLGFAVFAMLWLRRNPSGKPYLASGLALVLGGALGNVIDRAVRGYVVDFIDFHYQGWHWPAFNVADTAICIGAGLLIIDMFLEHRSDETG